MSAKHVLEKTDWLTPAKRVGIDSCLISTSTFIHQFLHLVPVVFIWEHMRHVSLVLLVLYVCEVPDWYISAEAGRRAILQGLRLLEQEQIFPELRVEGQVLDSTTTARCELRVFGSSVNAKKRCQSWCCMMLRMYLQGLCRSKRRRRSCCKCYRAASGYRKHQTPSAEELMFWCLLRASRCITTPFGMVFRPFFWLMFSDFRKFGFSMPWVKALERPEKTVQYTKMHTLSHLFVLWSLFQGHHPRIIRLIDIDNQDGNSPTWTFQVSTTDLERMCEDPRNMRLVLELCEGTHRRVG